MVELVGVHGLDETEIIRDGCEVGEAIRNPRPALTVLLELELWTEHFRSALDESELFSFEELLWAFLAIEFL